MAISEESRHALHRRLEEVLGTEAAGTLMEHLPPVGWADVATKRDLDNLGALIKRDLEVLRTQFEAHAALTKAQFNAHAALTKAQFNAHAALTKSQFEAHADLTKSQFEAHAALTKTQFDTHADRTKTQFDTHADLTKTQLDALEQRLRADVRSELITAITAQTRTIMFSVIGSNVTLGALAFAAASLR